MACGDNDKQKQQIVDFDTADVNDELAVVEYVDELYKFYKLEEVINMDPYIIFPQPTFSILGFFYYTFL